MTEPEYQPRDQTLEYPCPHCQALMELEPVHAGLIVPCPQCGGDVQAPAEVFPAPRVPGRVRRPRGQAEMFAAIIGLIGSAGAVVCNCLLPLALASPIATYLAWRLRQQDLRAGRRPDPQVQTAFVLGIIGTILLALYVVVMGGIFAFVMFTAAQNR